MSNPDFDLYRLSEDHRDLREAVRSVAEDKIAPYAADVDEQSSFPQAAYDALVASDFHAPHVPAEYDGVGADALATCVVIEEIARVCASSSLIPAVNKLGSLPLILGGSDDLKRRYLPSLASGAAAFSYGLSERDAGSDIASMRTRARGHGDDYVLSGQKSWITNAGFSEYYTVLAITDPEAGRGKGVSAFIVEKTDEGFTFGAKERKLGIKGSPTRELLFDNVRIPADRMIGEPGTGLALALRTLDHTRVTIGAQAVGIAQGALDVALGYVQERQQFGSSSPNSRASSSCLPTWPCTSRPPVSWCMSRPPSRSATTLTCPSSAPRRGFRLRYRHGGHHRCGPLLGGTGSLVDLPVERMMRDAKITQIYEGTNQVRRIVIARQLLVR